MIRNYYYLITGLLSILFAFSHAWNGQTSFLPSIEVARSEPTIQTTVFYVWHIITIENLIFGIAFLIMAFYKDLSKVRFAAWIILAIMIGRWMVIFGSTLIKNKNGLIDVLTDSIAIIIYIGLILLGIRVKEKIPVLKNENSTT